MSSLTPGGRSGEPEWRIEGTPQNEAFKDAETPLDPKALAVFDAATIQLRLDMTGVELLSDLGRQFYLMGLSEQFLLQAGLGGHDEWLVLRLRAYLARPKS